MCPPPNILPAIVHPTQQCVNQQQFTNIVPHIHPSHTTTINQHLFLHEHYFPHTHSVENVAFHQHVNCGMRPPGPFPY